MSVMILQQTKQSMHKLQEECLQMRNRLDTWCKIKTENADSFRKNLNETLNHSEGLVNFFTHISAFYIKTAIEYIKKLAFEQQQLALKLSTVEQELKEEQIEEDQLKESIRKVKEIESSLPQKLNQLKQLLQEKEALLQQEKQQYLETEKQRKEMLQQGSQTISLFEQCFGLRFEVDHTEGVLRLIFTQIDPTMPQRPFCLSVRIEKRLDISANQYQVVHCSPSIPLEPLVKSLNQSNNFRSFIIQVRQLFESVATTPSIQL